MVINEYLKLYHYIVPNIDDVLPHNKVSVFLNHLTDPELVPRRDVFSCRTSYSSNTIQVGNSISWIVCTVVSKACRREYGVIDVRWWNCSCYSTLCYIGKFNALRKLSYSNDQMIDNQIHLINGTKTLSIHSLLQTLRLGSYLVSTHTTNFGMPDL